MPQALLKNAASVRSPLSTQFAPFSGVLDFTKSSLSANPIFGVKADQQQSTQLLPLKATKANVRFRDVAVNQTPFTETLNLNQHLARVRAGKQPDERVRCFF
jgi:hypothetical protein